MKLKQVLAVFLLIGFLFNVFHDFVFYKIDPCMSKVQTFLTLDKGKKQDPLCEIHHNLHHSFTAGFHTIKVSFKPNQKEKFLYTPLNLKPYSRDIFKPPKHIS